MPFPILCHDHNLLARQPASGRRYGIRVSLPESDPLRQVLGENWEAFRWYHSEPERDQALRDMTAEHLYSRPGDRPSVVCEPIERANEPAGAKAK